MNITKAAAVALLATTLITPAAILDHSIPQSALAAPLSVDPPSPSKVSIFVSKDGVGSMHLVKPGTVEDALKAAGTPLGEADQVSAPRKSKVVDKQFILITTVTVKTVDKTVEVPFTTSKQDNKVACEKASDKTTVVTEGKKGKKVETWSEMVMGGEALPPAKLKEEVKAKPVNEVTADCEPPAPAVPPVTDNSASNNGSSASDSAASEPSSSSKSASSSKPSSSAPSTPREVEITGTKQDWMKAAGIPESDWTYVDYIVTRESGWNPKAVNSSSGACGLAQALPCSKLGPNWSDPVTALKWQYNYVSQRYGGYSGAYSFWLANHWY